MSNKIYGISLGHVDFSINEYTIINETKNTYRVKGEIVKWNVNKSKVFNCKEKYIDDNKNGDLWVKKEHLKIFMEMLESHYQKRIENIQTTCLKIQHLIVHGIESD